VDSNDQLASFSNYGSSSVQIAAPGVKILSTTVGSHYSDVVTTYTNAQGQSAEMDWDGTSMATPIVAGAVAAVWTAHPSEDYHQIRNRILSSARQVSGLSGKVSSGGILNVSGAIQM
jgi:subtilisin family serine protease